MRGGFPKITYSELNECKHVIGEPLGLKPGAVIPSEYEDVAIAVIAALHRKRYGWAAGSHAVHVESGRSALRYYDAQFKCLRWLVYDSPECQELKGERMDHLPDDGKGWKITERDWKEVLTR